MDKMEDYEINDILENLNYLDVPAWERSRLNAYATVQVNSRKQLKTTDIIKFPWDTENEDNTESTHISDEDIERLKKKSELIKFKINGK